jgi:hypothetical protein
LWLMYEVGLQIDGQFASSLPRTTEEIRSMLEHRMPTRKPDDAVPIDQLADQVALQVGATSKDDEDEDYLPSWATFKRDENGLYYEGRQIRGHIKDCALQIAPIKQARIKNFRSKVANKVYVMDDIIPLWTGPLFQSNGSNNDGRFTEVDGTEERFVQVMTRQGPRSAIKHIDYINDPYMSFRIKILNDGIITIADVETIFEYGSVHGIGQERSQGWGRYTVHHITDLTE